jgi:hypothetical protein
MDDLIPMNDMDELDGDARDWERPQSPGKVLALLEAFAAMTQDWAAPVVLSASPEWFDDIYFSATEVVHIHGHTASKGVASWSAWDDESAQGVSDRVPVGIEAFPTEAEREDLSRAFAAIKHAGPLGRDAVEEGLHPLDGTEIVSFLKIAVRGPEQHRVLLSITESNGYTDAAYEATSGGRLVFWSPAGFDEMLKDEEIPTEDKLPDRAAARPIAEALEVSAQRRP